MPVARVRWAALADELVHLLVLAELSHVGPHNDERAVVFDGHARAVDGLARVRCSRV